jgi:hypothetical protein
MDAMSGGTISRRPRSRANSPHSERDPLRKNFRDWILRYISSAAADCNEGTGRLARCRAMLRSMDHRFRARIPKPTDLRPGTTPHVRLGSIALFSPCADHFRPSPISRHSRRTSACIKRARRGDRSPKSPASGHLRAPSALLDLQLIIEFPFCHQSLQGTRCGSTGGVRARVPSVRLCPLARNSYGFVAVIFPISAVLYAKDRWNGPAT